MQAAGLGRYEPTNCPMMVCEAGVIANGQSTSLQGGLTAKDALITPTWE
jgi:hypothetical protein